MFDLFFFVEIFLLLVCTIGSKASSILYYSQISEYLTMHCNLLIFYAFCILKMASGEQSSLYMDEVRSLSELPMNKLIQIRSSLESPENGKLLSL